MSPDHLPSAKEGTAGNLPAADTPSLGGPGGLLIWINTHLERSATFVDSETAFYTTGCTAKHWTTLLSQQTTVGITDTSCFI
jgi:hypothetical protein